MILKYILWLGLESSEILNDEELESLYGMLPFSSANILYRATRDGSFLLILWKYRR